MGANNTIRISVTDDELAALISVTGLSPNQLSPVIGLAGHEGTMGADCRAELIKAGVFEPDRAALTQDGHDLLARILRPQTRIGICAGTSDWLATTISVAAGDLSGHEPTVSIGQDAGGWAIGWPQPPAALVAMLQDHFTGPVLNGVVPFEHTLSYGGYLAMLGVLDHILWTQLQSTLDRLPFVAIPFGVDEVWHQVVEGRTGSSLAWQVTVTGIVFPELRLDLDRTELETGFEEVRNKNLLLKDDEGGHLPSEGLLAVAEGLVPVFRFGAARVDRLIGQETLETTHVAIRAGLGTILLEEVDGEGVRIRSVGSLELEDLILNFRFPAVSEPAQTESSAATPGPSFCSQCGAAIEPGSVFCVKCGHRLRTEEQP